jgi:hypothetical protein
MKRINTIYKEVEKVNSIIEECYSYLRKSSTRNQERIQNLLDRAVKLRDHYLSKLRSAATPTASIDVENNLDYQVNEHYGRLMGF